MTDRLVLVGSRLAAYREYGLAALAAHDVVLVSGQPLTWERTYVSDYRLADTADPAAVLAAARELAGSAIFTWDESSLVATAEAAAMLGWPHLSPDAARACRDKLATRTLAGGVAHSLVADEAQAHAAAEEIGYPVVLKPRSLAGSMGVQIVAGPAELPAAYRRAATTTLAGVHSEPGVLVEEYLDGPEISVDAAVVDGVATPVFVARKRLGFPPYFEEVGHLVGPWRHERWAPELCRLLAQAHAALGITTGVTHAEFRLTARGPRLVELNGRLGGDLIPRLGHLATGVDLVSAAAEIAFGRAPELTPTADRYAEIRFLYPPHDGTVTGLDLTATAAVPGVADVVAFAAEGSVLALPPAMLTPRIAGVIAVANTERDCRSALDAAEATVRVTMSGSGLGAVVENAVTRRFLAPERGLARMVVSGPDTPWFRYGVDGGAMLNRPVLLSASDTEILEADLNGVFALVKSIPDRLFDGDRQAFAAAVGMTPTQIDVVTRGAGLRVPSLARADMYRETTGFKLMELNTGTSLGGWQMAEFAHAMMYDLPFREFAEDQGLVCPDPLAAIADVLVRECVGLDLASRPVIALTDWPDGFAETKCWLDFLIPGWLRLGFDPIVCHLGQFSYPGGVPHVGGRKVDVVYRVFLPGEMADEQRSLNLVDPLLTAARQGHTQLFAGLDCELYGNKGSLAMLSDERNRDAFDAAERVLIERVLPWTRFLRTEKARYRGELVDLVPHVLAAKDSLVLKPTLLYGGVGVRCGWTMSDAEWAAAIADAVGGPYVVQERVRPTAERFARANGTGLEELVVAYGVLVLGDRYAGMLARGVPDPDVGIVNMPAGARIGCAFHVARR